MTVSLLILPGSAIPYVQPVMPPGRLARLQLTIAQSYHAPTGSSETTPIPYVRPLPASTPPEMRHLPQSKIIVRLWHQAALVLLY